MSVRRAAVLRGIWSSAPFALVIGPFGLLFGVVGTEAGLDIVEVMGFSIIVIAGAAQFAAVQMLADHAPTVIILATSLAVNLRMAMYSASLTPHLGKAPVGMRAVMAYFLVDQTYAASMIEYDRNPEMSLGEKIAFFFGTVLPVCPLWYVSTYVGAKVGTAIPPEFALDFAVPITFLAMIAPLLRTAAHVAAAGVSVALALALAFVPYNGGLLIAAVAAMVTGAQVEAWTERRRAA
ncbi:AzlC family ABC transporter permease [Cereibacter sphaeroides]|uniref:AzlC family ABC transporter permease n=1 Tax=Rhodobacterales TaxID=204455 RepID=UPI000BBF09AF|nr:MULTISPECIES: AzlC family ABC transporter permease [Paracoccaceae]MCE6950489.1 AzlC family ABC transporter permease [Cereibacter sphaeroides]MCE6959478.1 AzlC family ABC transporter permease [Cereibacter sphaeroides]MCE6968249.1 AzlC family ABC transporter permease [Cereibacter sphaeroides]MCE6973751.1 AzlC family ABC transporter permease [Cereibacter sphaeroides]